MKKSSYILINLSLRKAPGFPSGMESLNNLASNVNIITGPNASGKSSTARAIQQLIWQSNTKGMSIQGSVKIEDDNWEIDIDSGRNRMERNGHEEQLKGLPALEGHHRYLLALHNFVEGNETDLAKEIARQSIGGFDLDAAYYNLGYTHKFQTQGAAEFKKHKETEKNYRELREKQLALKREEESLTVLKSNRDKAIHAAKLSDFYLEVEKYLEVKLEFNQLNEQLNQYPSSIKNLKGDEYKQIQALEAQIIECTRKIEDAKSEIEKSKKELDQLTISENGVAIKTSDEISERIEKLSEFERKSIDFKDKIAQEKVKEKNALNSIDSTIDPTDWKTIDLSDVSGLDKMLQNAHQIAGEKEFVISEIKHLEEEAKKYQKEQVKPETFSHGIKTLSEWLKEPIETKGIPLKTVLTIATFGIIAAITTYFIGVWGILVGALLFVVGFLYAKSSNGSESNALGIRENDFKKSGLTPPSHWDIQNVTKRIEELIENLIDSKESERISQKLIDCNSRLKNIEERMHSVVLEREKWKEKLQAAPGFPKSNSNDFSSLYWFLTHVKTWQEAHTQRVILETKLNDSLTQFDDELNKINTLFVQSNLAVASDLISAKATFAQLNKEENIRQNQTRNIELAQKTITEQEQLKQRDETRLVDIYQTIGINEEDKDSIQELIKQLETYTTIKQDHYSTNQALLKQESSLKAHSLYTEHEAEIDDLAIDQVKEKARKNKEEAEKLNDINEKIYKIEADINIVKAGNDLEDILTQKEEDLDALHQLYENNLALTTGDLIISELREETQNKNRPEVFQKANEVFSKITLGRYNLKLNEKDNVSFEAIDNVLNRSYSLSELSTGTRVQLLLAVRLAYVETVESSIKLPLLADELLANSDDERAKAIIEALIEISREGRQVFYFTAQADEVGKWQAHLNQTELEHKVIQLNNKGNETYTSGDFIPDLSNFSLSQGIPKPKGESHREYGQLLSFQPFNMLTQSSAELPLWYLIEDLDILYSALDRGIKVWGQLESFTKSNGKINTLDENKFHELSIRIEILDKFQELHRIGRSFPIDRAVLQNSGAITTSFIDKVSEKLEELKGNPQLLLSALRNGEVPRFRADSADELEAYLLSEGFIDDKEIMSSDDILIRMQALISTMEIDNKTVEEFLERVVGR